MINDTKMSRENYPHNLDIAVRWSDYNMARHVSNVTYYDYIEEAVVDLLKVLGLDWDNSSVIPFVAESTCRYFSEIPFPSNVSAGIGIVRIGNSSLTYQIALFVEGSDRAIALANFVHVFVDRNTKQPNPIPKGLRQKAETFLLS
ncbi:MAG: acyl-CoA thioesterase [Magnetovibrio sp.]|nr:acyl-CoA thioesterase [Magnetovibrio sp.]